MGGRNGAVKRSLVGKHYIVHAPSLRWRFCINLSINLCRIMPFVSEICKGEEVLT